MTTEVVLHAEGNYTIAAVPGFVFVNTDVSNATITTAGWLNSVTDQKIHVTDIIVVNYASNAKAFYNPSIDGNGIITLSPVSNPGEVSLVGAAVNGNAIKFNGTTGDIEDAGYAASNVALLANTTSNTAFTTTNPGSTIRLNVRTESTSVANSLIGFQAKPGRGLSGATDVIGGEISPRLNDAIALTGSASIIGLHTDVYLKGTTGNIAGDVRGQQIELVDDTGSSRTIAGNITHLRVRSNLSCTVTGKYSVFRVENEEGTKSLDALYQFTTGVGCLVETAGTVGGTQDQAIKILIGTTTYYVPLYTSVS